MNIEAIHADERGRLSVPVGNVITHQPPLKVKARQQ